MTVKGNHPLAEIIAQCLFSIETVPKEGQRRMVNRAAKKAVAYHKAEIARLEGDLVKAQFPSFELSVTVNGSFFNVDCDELDIHEGGATIEAAFENFKEFFYADFAHWLDAHDSDLSVSAIELKRIYQSHRCDKDEEEEE